MVPTTTGRLRDKLAAGGDFDGAFYSLACGVESLRERFGDAKADQLLDMIRQAKMHYGAGDKLGSRLLQDTEIVVLKRQPYAYPKELNRWRINPWLPELSEADVPDKKNDEG